MISATHGSTKSFGENRGGRGRAHYPRCVAGENACPPEDVGGVWGYVDFLQAINNPEHNQHEEFLEWVGGEFDPEKFDLDAVNELLSKNRENYEFERAASFRRAI